MKKLVIVDHNLSSYSPNPAELSVLELGLNFNAGPALDTRKLICAVEQAIGQVENSSRDEARTRAVGILAKLPRHPRTPLVAEKRDAIKSVRSNMDIVILPADKGNSTVILNSDDYVGKMSDLLQDDSTYVKLKRHSTLKVEGSLQMLFADVFRLVPPQRKSLYFKLLCHNG